MQMRNPYQKLPMHDVPTKYIKQGTWQRFKNALCALVEQPSCYTSHYKLSPHNPIKPLFSGMTRLFKSSSHTDECAKRQYKNADIADMQSMQACNLTQASNYLVQEKQQKKTIRADCLLEAIYLQKSYKSATNLNKQTIVNLQTSLYEQALTGLSACQIKRNQKSRTQAAKFSFMPRFIVGGSLSALSSIGSLLATQLPVMGLISQLSNLTIAPLSGFAMGSARIFTKLREELYCVGGLFKPKGGIEKPDCISVANQRLQKMVGVKSLLNDMSEKHLNHSKPLSADAIQLISNLNQQLKHKQPLTQMHLFLKDYMQNNQVLNDDCKAIIETIKAHVKYLSQQLKQAIYAEKNETAGSKAQIAINLSFGSLILGASIIGDVGFFTGLLPLKLAGASIAMGASSLQYMYNLGCAPKDFQRKYQQTANSAIACLHLQEDSSGLQQLNQLRQQSLLQLSNIQQTINQTLHTQPKFNLLLSSIASLPEARDNFLQLLKIIEQNTQSMENTCLSKKLTKNIEQNIELTFKHLLQQPRLCDLLNIHLPNQNLTDLCNEFSQIFIEQIQTNSNPILNKLSKTMQTYAKQVDAQMMQTNESLLKNLKQIIDTADSKNKQQAKESIALIEQEEKQKSFISIDDDFNSLTNTHVGHFTYRIQLMHQFINARFNQHLQTLHQQTESANNVKNSKLVQENSKFEAQSTKHILNQLVHDKQILVQIETLLKNSSNANAEQTQANIEKLLQQCSYEETIKDTKDGAKKSMVCVQQAFCHVDVCLSLAQVGKKDLIGERMRYWSSYILPAMYPSLAGVLSIGVGSAINEACNLNYPQPQQVKSSSSAVMPFTILSSGLNAQLRDVHKGRANARAQSLVKAQQTQTVEDFSAMNLEPMLKLFECEKSLSFHRLCKTAKQVQRKTFRAMAPHYLNSLCLGLPSRIRASRQRNIAKHFV